MVRAQSTELAGVWPDALSTLKPRKSATHWPGTGSAISLSESLAQSCSGFRTRRRTSGANAINRGNPYCEDYNEQMFCGATSNVNACANNQALGLALGSGGTVVSTTCGNGVVEAFEDCDDGVAGTSTQRSGTAGNGQPGDTCSTLCLSTTR
jgi:hypothetical protein